MGLLATMTPDNYLRAISRSCTAGHDGLLEGKGGGVGEGRLGGGGVVGVVGEQVGLHHDDEQAGDEGHGWDLLSRRCVEYHGVASKGLQDLLLQHYVVVVTLMLDEVPHPLHHTPLEYLPPHLPVNLQPHPRPHAADAHHAGYHSPSAGLHYQVKHLVCLGPSHLLQLLQHQQGHQRKYNL